VVFDDTTSSVRLWKLGRYFWISSFSFRAKRKKI